MVQEDQRAARHIRHRWVVQEGHSHFRWADVRQGQVDPWAGRHLRQRGVPQVLLLLLLLLPRLPRMRALCSENLLLETLPAHQAHGGTHTR